MSRSATLPLGVRAPEPLTLLHRRLMLAEEEAEGLVRDMGALGVPRGRIVGSAPSSPTKEHRASGREAMELRDRLRRACRERDEARREVGRLGQRVEEAAAAKVDVALAADELKVVKLEMSQKLTEMRRQLEEEAERRWALRTRLIEQLRNQDLLLEATRRNAHSELQVALTDKVNLQLELEKLKDGHSRLLQSSSAAREAAATQREVLERTIERLRGELSTARQQESGTEFREQEAADGQTLETNQASRDELHLKQEDSARLQAQREIGKHRAEVEKLQWLLTSTHSKSSRALESLQKASDAARVINKRLAQSLERHRVAAALRDEELLEARSKIGRLSEELGAAKRRRREDESAETPRREPSELTRSAGDSSAGSGDLSTANRELRRRASELERLVSEQTAFIREQRSRELHKAEVSPQQEAELERWTSTIRRWEAKRALADTDKKRRSDTVTL
ncbi:coiled-coil domain-containing protein 150-like isoform X2 [Cyclopterus lumpus]|uniref:coiled-coil domain-containing protein 150-like isoform X2 n=1 Tax=Cyclopterus lumpus TaxID=8103 RepID=UPI001485E49C|nr:coiled-coil domain-containing protein 150-like isoform X2 [Cyclopterus lumpus]XP_034404715.1 coiled-coil domain-containing protein 150-like isoform X2 [Cyclopterus lumpus]